MYGNDAHSRVSQKKGTMKFKKFQDRKSYDIQAVLKNEQRDLHSENDKFNHRHRLFEED